MRRWAERSSDMGEARAPGEIWEKCAYWRWKSRPRGGRPGTSAEIRCLIREMSVANPLWGAPRRHQLNVLRRKSPKRVALSSVDRLLLVGLYRLAPRVLEALKIIRPETLLRWHRAGFRVVS